MKLTKNEKGKKGYINKQKILETIKTIVLFSFAIGLYLIGYITLKTNKSLWTIFAVLSVLPAAKSAVSMIMFFRFKSIDDNLFSKIEVAKGAIPTLYELVFTTSEKAFYVKAASCCDKTCILLLEDSKAKNSLKDIKDHITSAIDREGFGGYLLKIYVKDEEYIARLSEMREKLKTDNDMSSVNLFALFKAITL